MTGDRKGKNQSHPRPPRRDFLAASSMASATAFLGSCSRRLPLSFVAETPPRKLARVNVSRERVIRTIAGLRPYRDSGFVVRAEKFGDKTVVHNYGHGGGGISLSWGCSHLAVEEATMTGEREYAVLGSGCMSLCSARLPQDRGFRVTIYAKDLPPNTT